MDLIRVGVECCNRARLGFGCLVLVSHAFETFLGVLDALFNDIGVGLLIWMGSRIPGEFLAILFFFREESG